MSRLSLLLTPIAGLVLTVGCGGSDDPAPGTPDTPAVVVATRASGSTSAAGGPTPGAGATTSISVKGYTDADVKNYVVSLAYSAQIGGPRVVHKWAQPIRYIVYGDPTNIDKFNIEEAMRDIATLTKLSVTLAKSPGEENFAFYFTDQKDAAKAGFTTPVNRAGYYIRSQGATGDNDIGKVGILIDTGANPTALSTSLRAMMVKGLVGRRLGLINQVSTYKESIFTPLSAQDVNVDPIVNYRDIDRKVIQLLYADTVKAGMTEQQLRAALDAMK